MAIAILMASLSLAQDAPGRNAPHSPAALLRQCNGDEAHACLELGRRYERGKDLLPSDAKAVELYRRACNISDAACDHLGRMYEDGRGSVRQSDAKAGEYHARACEKGSASGCALLGRMYEEGRGRALPDYVMAAKMYTRACDADMAGSCFLLARLYRKGLGVPRSRARASALLTKACSLGLAPGCIGTRGSHGVRPIVPNNGD